MSTAKKDQPSTGWRTSEGQLTAAVAGLYALGQTAEAAGLIPAGTVDHLWPLAALAGGYTVNRTWLKVKGPGLRSCITSRRD